MEKSKKVIRYVSCFTVLLILLSILPATAFAGNDKAVNGAENGKSWKVVNNSEDSNTEEDVDTEEEADDDDSASEPLNKKELIQQRVLEKKQFKEQIQTQKREYQDAKGAFLRIRNQIRAGEFGESQREVTRAYLTSSIDYMIAHLENIIYNLEQSNSNSTEERIDAIEKQIDQLEEEKEDIENADNLEEFANSATSVRGVWNNAKKNASLEAGQTVSEKMEESLDKSESLSEVLRDRIQILK
ncbi:TPA: hypothetical protein HA351_11485 [Methanosarcinaceae archaeon]|nr:hypothetical protein [Methanosarcinaceae archaeon]